MLVLSRKVNEEIIIGDNIRIRIVDIGAGRIRIGISAPREVTVLRDEVIRDKEDPLQPDEPDEILPDDFTAPVSPQRHRRILHPQRFDVWINPDVDSELKRELSRMPR